MAKIRNYAEEVIIPLFENASCELKYRYFGKSGKPYPTLEVVCDPNMYNKIVSLGPFQVGCTVIQDNDDYFTNDSLVVPGSEDQIRAVFENSTGKKGLAYMIKIPKGFQLIFSHPHYYPLRRLELTWHKIMLTSIEIKKP